MGPTNLALVKLFEADRKLREAQATLETASHAVRIQDRRVHDLSEKVRIGQQTFKEQQAKHANLEMDLRSRDQHIEKLRNQQQSAKNNKEYQALLVEINTRKVDRGKVEEQTLQLLDAAEKLKKEIAANLAALETEKAKLATLKEQNGDILAKLQADVDAVRPEREAAESAVPPKVRDIFNRLADRFDGEAMAGIDRPDKRKEEYLCTSCNMELVRDIYNKLKSRDDVVFCPNCQRILFIPDHFTAEMAIGGPKVTVKRSTKATVKTAKPKKPAADGSAAPAEPEDKNVVIIEQRASGLLGTALAKAQGESVSRAVAADTKPQEFEVHVNGELAGIYKGIAQDNLERAIKYFLGELKIEFTSLVLKPTQVETAASPEAPAETAAAPASTEPAPTN